MQARRGTRSFLEREVECAAADRAAEHALEEVLGVVAADDPERGEHCRGDNDGQDDGQGERLAHDARTRAIVVGEVPQVRIWEAQRLLICSAVSVACWNAPSRQL